MRLARVLLAGAALAAAVAPSAASAGNQCKPYFYTQQVGPLTVTLVDVVC